MTNFFTRMSERSLGLTPTVHPILSPRFADNSFGPKAPGLSNPVETSQQMHKISNPLGDSAVEKGSDSLIADSSVTESERPGMPVGRARDRRDQTIATKDTARKMTTDTLYPEEKKIHPTELVQPNPIIDKNHHSENPRPSTLSKQIPVQYEPLLPLKPKSNKESPHTKETGRSSPDQNNHSKPNLVSISTKQPNVRQEAPVIKVNIGRIDVRAVHRAPAPSKDSKASSSSALSLDDYLQQRRRGER